ncbi:hypothetical protein B0H11DRAFT_2229799 [Mycena galericulata]|nr:hypothetical protein B0H11DRAFT_2229799 [Mycena galericulata]
MASPPPGMRSKDKRGYPLDPFFHLWHPLCESLLDLLMDREAMDDTRDAQLKGAVTSAMPFLGRLRYQFHNRDMPEDLKRLLYPLRRICRHLPDELSAELKLHRPPLVKAWPVIILSSLLMPCSNFLGFLLAEISFGSQLGYAPGQRLLCRCDAVEDAFAGASGYSDSVGVQDCGQPAPKSINTCGVDAFRDRFENSGPDVVEHVERMIDNFNNSLDILAERSHPDHIASFDPSRAAHENKDRASPGPSVQYDVGDDDAEGSVEEEESMES